MWQFGIFSPVLVFWTDKNLATLVFTAVNELSVEQLVFLYIRRWWYDENVFFQSLKRTFFRGSFKFNAQRGTFMTEPSHFPAFL
jgi:hypothetical protein